MKLFYTDYTRHESILANDAIESDAMRAVQILNRLSSEGSFLGIVYPSGFVLQFYREKSGAFSIELVDKDLKLIETCEVNMPLAELALVAGFDGKDVKKELSDYFIQWKRPAWSI